MAKRDFSRIADWADPLGLRLVAKFEDAEKARQDVEKRWLNALRRYRGRYDDGTLSRLDKNRSRTFIRSGRVKVESLTRLELSRMLGANESSWTIDPTPNPDVSDKDWQGLVDRVLRAKPDAGPDDFDAAVRALANVRARNMTREIRDQLDGNPDRRWSELLRRAVFSKNLYGTGCLKGPMVEEYYETAWKQIPVTDPATGLPAVDPQTGQPQLSWMPQRVKSLRPYVEQVPLWALYPEGSAKDIESATGVFQRHVFTKPELQRLGRREDFDAEKIKRFIQEYPEGNADEWKSYETDLNQLSDDRSGTQKRERQYEVLEFWGLVPLKDMEVLGCVAPKSLGELDPDDDVWSHCWLLGPCVVKAAVQPLDDMAHPYKLGYFDKDESSIWGYGLMDLTEDTQDMLNAGVRILLDNAAICAGPQIEVNIDMVDVGPDELQNVYPFKVWPRGGNGQMIESGAPAVRVTPIPSMSQDVLGIIQLAERFNDEISGVPSSDTGDIGRISKDQTATEASIRSQRSNTMVLEQCLRWDDNVTRPMITDIYKWNMQFNPREDIKGDFEIKARGVAGTQAREIRAQQLVAFWQMVMGDPEARSMVKVEEVLRTISQNMEVPDTIMRDATESQQWREQQMQQQAMASGQMVMQQVGPVLQQHQQALQQLAQQVQQVVAQAQQPGADGNPEIALKAAAQEKEFTLKAQAQEREFALKERAMAFDQDLRRKELAAGLEMKRAEHLDKAAGRADEIAWKRGQALGKTQQPGGMQPCGPEGGPKGPHPEGGPGAVVNIVIAGQGEGQEADDGADSEKPGGDEGEAA